MVWPIAPDRLSPSGPILPFQQGTIIQVGSDQPREPLVYDSLDPPPPFFVPRDQAATEVVQVPLVGYTPGNGILITWQTNCEFTSGEDDAKAGILAFPVLNVGDPLMVGSTLLVNNCFGGHLFDPDNSPGSESKVNLWTQSALIVPPPELVEADPVVGILWTFLFELDGRLLFGGGEVDLTNPLEAVPLSCWLTVAEIDARAVPTVAPTTLTPLP